MREWILAITAVVGGALALWNYWAGRQVQTGQWMDRLYERFYGSENFNEIRLKLEYAYYDALEPCILKAVLRPEAPLSRRELELMCRLDNFLNYLEHVLHLVQGGNLKRSDMLAMFDFWLRHLRGGAFGTVRHYASLGYERLAEAIDGEKITRVFWPDYVSDAAPGGDAFVADVDHGIFDGLTAPGMKLDPRGRAQIRGRLIRPPMDDVSAAVRSLHAALKAEHPQDTFLLTGVRVTTVHGATVDAWTYIVRT